MHCDTATPTKSASHPTRRLVALALTGGLLVLAATESTILATIVSGVGQVSPLPAVIGIILSVAAILNRGLLSTWSHRGVGLDVDVMPMTRTATVGFAANKILRSGGASGLAVYVRDGKRRHLPPGRVVGACAVASVASFAALGLLMAGTVALLALSGRLAGWWVAAAIGFSVYSVLLATLIAAVVRSPMITRKIFILGWRLKARVTRGSPLTAAGRAVTAADDLHRSIAAARRHPDETRRVLAHAVMSKVLGAAALFAAAAAAGISMSPVTAMILYSSALATSLVSVAPGGVGPVEASTAAMMVGVGASVPAAALAVGLFRVFDMWLPVAAGAYLGRHEIRRGDPTVETVTPTSPQVLTAAPLAA